MGSGRSAGRAAAIGGGGRWQRADGQRTFCARVCILEGPGDYRCCFRIASDTTMCGCSQHKCARGGSITAQVFGLSGQHALCKQMLKEYKSYEGDISSLTVGDSVQNYPKMLEQSLDTSG